MDDIKKSYIAGLMDGEGSVMLCRMKKNEHRSPSVSVSSTSYELLEEINLVFPGTICSKKLQKSHHKASWQWQLTGNKAISFLEEISPFMKEKIKVYRATLIINEYKSVTPRNGKYSDSLLEKKANFEYRFFHPSTP